MKAPLMKIVNVETGEEIEREMNNEEMAQSQADEAIEQAKIQARALAIAAKAALLEKLGITADEAKLLLSQHNP